MIPIPIGVHRTVTVAAQREDSATCERCGAAFAFVVTCTGRGYSFQGLFGDERLADTRALERAQRNLRVALRSSVQPAVCPCGAMPRYLAAAWRRRQFTVFSAIPLSLAILLFFLGLAFETRALLFPALVALGVGLLLGIFGSHLLPHDAGVRRLHHLLQPLQGFTMSQREAALTAAERMRARESKRLMESENPEDRWECPKCKVANPNNTFKCSGCGLALV